MDERDRKLVWRVGLFAVAVLWIVIGAVMSSGDDAEPEIEAPDAPEISQVDEDACLDEVRARLRVPESADFSIAERYVEEVPSGTEILGAVTADNGFGTERALAYRCTISPGGAVLEVSVEPKRRE